MTGTQISFNLNEARRTRQELEMETIRIRNALGKLSVEVHKTNKWWEGQSQKDFERIFETRQEEVVRALGNWLTSYGDLILKFGAAYQKADASMFNGQ